MSAGISLFWAARVDLPEMGSVSGKTVATVPARCGNPSESEACSMNDIALLFVKSKCVSEIPQIKITTTSLLALEY